jgi:hypothetical protein
VPPEPAHRYIPIHKSIGLGAAAVAAGALPATPARAHGFIDPSAFQQVELVKGVDPVGDQQRRLDRVRPVRLSGAAPFTARVSSGGAGGTPSLRAGSPTGPPLGSATGADTTHTFAPVTATSTGDSAARIYEIEVYAS